jgi:hypothetical protein
LPRSMSDLVRIAPRNSAVDVAVTDSLLLLRLRLDGPTSAEDSAQAADHPLHETNTRRARTADVKEKWRTDKRTFIDLAQFAI